MDPLQPYREQLERDIRKLARQSGTPVRFFGLAEQTRWERFRLWVQRWKVGA